MIWLLYNCCLQVNQTRKVENLVGLNIQLVNIAFNRNGNIAHNRWIVTKLAVGSMEEECRSSSDKSDCDTDKELDKAG